MTLFQQFFANQFQLSLKPGYTKSWAPSSQDDASLTLSATKGWAFIRPAPATTRVATLSADLGNTSSLERGDKGPHAVVKAGVSGTIDLTTGVTLGMQAVANQNSGVGFTGIPGVTDTTRRNEVNLSQSLVFKLAGGQPVTFSIQENHLGTGSRDIAITTDLGYKLPPLTPRAKKP